MLAPGCRTLKAHARHRSERWSWAASDGDRDREAGPAGCTPRMPQDGQGARDAGRGGPDPAWPSPPVLGRERTLQAGASRGSHAANEAVPEERRIRTFRVSRVSEKQPQPHRPEAHAADWRSHRPGHESRAPGTPGVYRQPGRGLTSKEERAGRGHGQGLSRDNRHTLSRHHRTQAPSWPRAWSRTPAAGDKHPAEV